MPFGLFRRRDPRAQVVRALYGAIVTQARQAPLYLQYGVPDTVEGRFESVVLHVFLVLHRLKGEPPPAADFAQELFDLFLSDMDHSLRELGVGDLSVPKKMKKMGEAFYGRTRAYDEALAAGDGEALEAALVKNIVGAGGDASRALRHYVLSSVATLSGLTREAVMAGEVAFAPLFAQGDA